MKSVAPRILRWFALCLLFGLFGPASAQTPDHPATVPAAYVEQARKTIDTVLAEPEFSRTRTVKEMKIKDSPDGKKSLLERILEWLFKHFRDSPQNADPSSASFFAQFGQIGLWLLVFALVALLAVYAKHWLPFFGWSRSRAAPSPPVQQIDSALEITEALPEDIAATAERYWKEGKKTEALSLLYRGTIDLLTTLHRIDLPQGATEEEMRLLVASAVPSFKDDFGNIARAWLRLAYAHRPPVEIASLLAGFSRLRQVGGAVS